MAITDNVASKLLTLDEVLQEQYYNEFLEQSYRHGRKTNLIIPFAEEGEFEVDGDGVNIQVERGYGDSARPSNSPLSDFPTPRPFDPDKYKVRFSESDASTNDFTTINASAKVTHLQLATGGAGAIVDVAQRVFTQLMEDWQEKLAILRNLDRTGRIALVNGTPKKNDRESYNAASATVSVNSDGARFQVDNGAIAAFHPNMRISFYNGTTPVATNVRITDVNYGEPSIGVEFLSTGDDLSSGSLASVADNNAIYFSEAYNVGMYSMGAWFARPTVDETFIGGRDRTEAASRHLLTTAIREGASATQITLGILNQAARASNFVQEAEQSVVLVGDTEMIDSLRSRLDDNAIVQQPPGGQAGRIYEMGAMEVAFQHPQFGRSILMADPLMLPNQLRIIVPETWRSLFYGWRGLQMLPQGEGFGNWYRMEAATPGTGKSKVYKCDGYSNMCDVCLKPNKNIAVLNVTP